MVAILQAGNIFFSGHGDFCFNIKTVGSGDPVSPAPPGAALFRYHIRWSSSPDLPAALT